MLSAMVAADMALWLRLPFFAGGGAGGSGCGGGAGAVVGVMPDWWMRSALRRLKIRCIAGRTNTSSSMKKR